MPARHTWTRVLVTAAAVCTLAAPLAAVPAAADGALDNPLPSTYVSPAAPGGRLDDLGSPMSSLTVVEGAFGHLPDGRLVAYAAPMGENAQLNVSTTTFPEPTTQLGRHPMPGASGDATIAVAPDGKVYVGTFYEGRLFQWDPATGAMTNLGRATSEATYLYGLSVADDGTVYGGSYPDAHAWSFKPGNGFADLGRVTDDQDVKYARSTTYDPVHNALYVGTAPVGKVFRLDLATGQTSEIPLAPNAKPASAVADLDYADGQILVNLDGMLRAIDTNTNTEVPVVDGDTGQVTTSYPMSARGVSPVRQGGVYTSSVYNGAVHVVRYDLATHTVKRTGITSRRGALVGYGWNSENGHDVLYAFAGNYSGGGFRYDIDSGESGSLQYQITASPSPLQHVLPNHDGSKVFVDAFLNGNTSVYDVATGTSAPIARVGQVEDWTLHDGTVFAGTYPNGSLVGLPEDTGTPLTTYTRLQDTDSQIRPIEAKEHDGKIWFGTEPDYGLRGGAIAVLDPATKAVDVTRNVVPDHTIASLAFLDDSVYAGTSTQGGTGTVPAPGDARLVRWDPATKAVVRSVSPVAGAGSVNALTVHNGHLYGLADGTLFEANPGTLAVTRSLHLNVSGGFGASGGELVFHPNGYLYVSAGSSMVVVDPLAFVQKTSVTAAQLRLELSPDQTMWTLLRPDGFTNFLHLGRYTPTATRCPTPDTRGYVTLNGSTTTVRNRFLETGCTLQDLLLRRTGRDADVPTVKPWLDRLIATGQLGTTERDLLWAAVRNDGR
ncbi:Outer membrane protein assembly factor BamB, contains PQQ-like beta-propeller repeat [Actinopolymorpha cephalotaxi]|uniref:Outer membrane protein assembly factor BamB, contains PQQ-like beta-propeller repeat n=1 Tax=Actinopolymorpha cephalotaxi TaxID=504797 RepID=A0A1I2WVD9_9ACTN|nr:hypothetical protein [Actinopolymorpha cephalotaxi]NYH85145.1 hypothetical protein [Actinopolymorpha cephalotaxi]SFH05212.1 Outer membrane protein assembly factor BamB, contains PQQ-like beta-propeller repeat [Actinopolymorpha cephalotaxi]